MTILRRHLSTGYTVLPTATLEDARLSFRARGILAYLLAKPDSWKVRAETIANAGKEGVEAVRTALRELKDAGYYRVVTERLVDGTLHRITEVYDQAQEWAADEYRRHEEQRVKRRSKRAAKKATAAKTEDKGAATETGFPGVGSPGGGSPGPGSPGFIGSNQSKYSKKETPLTPAADAAGEPADADGKAAAPEAPSCPAHPDRPGSSCRGCGTSPREQRRARERAEKERCKVREREASERLLAEMRQRPDDQGLSDVAVQRIAEMRAVRMRQLREGVVNGESSTGNRLVLT
ncbi:hypothetical protein [Streptomyces sp. NPDC002851]